MYFLKRRETTELLTEGGDTWGTPVLREAQAKLLEVKESKKYSHIWKRKEYDIYFKSEKTKKQ